MKIVSVNYSSYMNLFLERQETNNEETKKIDDSERIGATTFRNISFNNDDEANFMIKKAPSFIYYKNISFIDCTRTMGHHADITR